MIARSSDCTTMVGWRELIRPVAVTVRSMRVTAASSKARTSATAEIRKVERAKGGAGSASSAPVSER